MKYYIVTKKYALRNVSYQNNNFVFITAENSIVQTIFCVMAKL